MLVRAKTDVRQLIMRHNHKNHIGSLCKSVFDFLSSKLEKPKQHIGHQRSEKPLYFLLPKKKNENQILKNGKTRNRWRTATWPTKVEKPKFLLQKPKNRPKKWPKPKIPTRPSPNSNPWPCLLITSWFSSWRFYSKNYACRRRRKEKNCKWVKDHRFLADQFVSIVQDCLKDKDQ